jgi:nitroreductase/CBS domain-containing protein
MGDFSMNIILLLTPKKQVTTVEEEMTVSEALQVMNVSRYTSVPLLNSEGQYVGTITEGDLLMSLLSQPSTKTWGKLPLKDIKRVRDNVPVKVNAPIDNIFITLINQNFIPILDDRDVFIGIVKRSDLINYYLEQYKESKEDDATTILNNIKARRSIRNWKDDEIDRSIINKIIMSGLVAPSAMNRKPVHIMLVSRDEVREEIVNCHSRFRLLEKAPYALFVYGDTVAEPNELHLNNNCSASIQNMLLAISALGLGGVWIGAGDEAVSKEVSNLLNVPQVMKLYGAIAFGVKNEEKEPNETFDLGKVHYEGW